MTHTCQHIAASEGTTFPLSLARWHTHTHVHTHTQTHIPICTYGVATVRRLLEMIGLFCTRALYKRLYSAKETYNLTLPTHCSHPLADAHTHTHTATP